MLADWPSLLFNALGWGMATFLVAAGLTLIFGILHVLNFSHGGVFMLGAYVAFTLTRWSGTGGLASFLGASLLAALATGVVGLAVDRAVFRRLAAVDGAYVLVATYALLLVCNGVAKLVWGLNVFSAAPPESLMTVTVAGDVVMPHYALFVIGAGLSVYLGLEWLLNRTAAGRMIQAIAADPWMARLLGIDVGLVYTGTVVLGFALAGLAGGLLVANQSLSPDLAGIFIIQAFGVVIVGGMGSIRGAFLASLLLGLVDSFGSALLPSMPGILFFVALALVLLVRPQGLLGSGRLA
ncbi:High-affinity branched-chain amino acid transport system permease protein LivH [Methylobacterium crusticola]|uniref:High-affinity branched-chain amino acid transport system permease protein LivH n=1 Tax=Methylobacterium crusticola TaxID=1697972 RepID=A0ABQ4R3J3_9HYPH|nr:branched-chain amino acid ABC transporter permease [Methylobacterium crusticola]GJD52212.1 High-affinity branched-chain amino acid transport system permease protein LivH [Methylobacterium crusticola]